MNDIIVVGLGVMGKSLALNMLSKGFKVAGYNRTYAVTKQLEGTKNFEGFEHLADGIASLSKPRKVFLMVPAGKPVDQMIEQLLPLLEPNDIIMDGGNSYYRDDEKRYDLLEKHGIGYMAVGVSGGEKGALYGPSIMPSGKKEDYDQVAGILETIAAKKDGIPCCTYIGPKGSGHYVKMVHNGIEYADMQLIVEVYLLLKASGKSNHEISAILEGWNQGPMESYLLSITVDILKEKDEQTGQDLVDLIVDASSNKGTGKWTSQEALVQDQNASLIHGAFMARLMSNEKQLRKLYGQNYQSANVSVEQLKQAYYLARIIAYAQGFGLYIDASRRYDWQLNLEKIALIFRAGCIIQAKLLDDLSQIFKNESEISSLLETQFVQKIVKESRQSLKEVCLAAMQADVATPLLFNAHIYLNQISSTALGANLIQAQRDYFGAHTFERIDQEGIFHHEWTQSIDF